MESNSFIFNKYPKKETLTNVFKCYNNQKTDCLTRKRVRVGGLKIFIIENLYL